MITRKEILDFLRDESDRPIMDMDLQSYFKIEGTDIGVFHSLLDDLERSGDIIRTKNEKLLYQNVLVLL